MVHFDGHKRKFSLYWLDIVRDGNWISFNCPMCIVHSLQLVKLENRKFKIEYLPTKRCALPPTFPPISLSTESKGGQCQRFKRSGRKTFNPKARVHVKDATNRWLSISVGQKLQGRSMPSVKGERSHMKENLGIWGVDHPTTTFTTKIKKLNSSRDLCSGVKCDLGGSSKWIKFNRRTDRSGKLVIWYNGPLILGPICWPSQD